ncbi:hypothetical protein [Burkholderia glumae]|uniref:hypothetical protein n=1 Tax=Burkholderia glumae TaxID=337 RepID=UPI0020B3DA38|nr:hypothetical protein [Burkholderia glumae]MCQ0034515.1 hypothetical protein [Burkholderia glumae]MCQ0040366.1 hypothetical protein [Burkholderia glumae]
MVSIYEVGGPRQQERSRCAEYQLGARGKPVRWGSAALASAHARRARSGRTRARRATRHASPGLRVRTGQRLPRLWFQTGMLGNPPPGFVLRRPQAAAADRLLRFPCAGGGSLSYRRWALALPGWLEVAAVEPPGRRIGSPQ